MAGLEDVIKARNAKKWVDQEYEAEQAAKAAEEAEANKPGILDGLSLKGIARSILPDVAAANDTAVANDPNYGNYSGFTPAVDSYMNGLQEWADTQTKKYSPNYHEDIEKYGKEMAQEHPYLNSIARSAMGGFGTAMGNIRSYLTGDNSVKELADEYEKQTQEQHEEWNKKYGDNFWTNPGKAASYAGSALGFLPLTFAAGEAVPASIAARGVGLLGSGLGRIGLGRVASSAAGKAILDDAVRGWSSGAVDALSEAGSVAYDLQQQGYSRGDAIAKSLPVLAENLAVNAVMSPLEYAGMKGAGAKIFKAADGEKLAKRLAMAPFRAAPTMAVTGAVEGLQEETQQAISNAATGQPWGNPLNPFAWTPDQTESFIAGAFGGAMLGAPANIAGSIVNTKTGYNSADSLSEELNNQKTGAPKMGGVDASNTTTGYTSADSLGEELNRTTSQTDNRRVAMEDFLNTMDVEDVGDELYTQMANAVRNGDANAVNTAYQNMQTYLSDMQNATQSAPKPQEAKINTNDPIQTQAVSIANQYGLDPAIFTAMIQKESSFDPQANNGSHFGLGQLSEERLNAYGITDWTDPVQNMTGAAKYLKEMLDRYNGDYRLALAAYNAGPGNVDEAGGIPDFAETQDYVKTIMNNAGSGGTAMPDSDFDSLFSNAVNSGLVGQEMENGKNGCAEFVTKFGSKYSPFLQEELDKGVVYVPTLVADAKEKGVNVIDFNPAALEKGDVIVYSTSEGENGHVVVYDGEGGFYGNSSSSGENGLTVHGSNYNIEGMTPTHIIKTGSTSIGTNVNDTINFEQTKIPEFAGFMKDNATGKDADIFNGMFTTDENGNEVFEDTKKNREIIEKQYGNDFQDFLKEEREKQRRDLAQDVQNAGNATTLSRDNRNSATTANTANLGDLGKNGYVERARSAQTGVTNEQSGNQSQNQTASTTNLPNQNVNTVSRQGETIENQTNGNQENNTAEILRTRPTGNKETLRTDDLKTEIPSTYKLVSADDLVSSDRANYPQEYQPRNRNRAAMQKQVWEMANSLRPGALVDSTGNVNLGAPVINGNGVVLNGNGRTMAIRSAYEQNNPSSARYKQYLLDSAEKLGFTQDDINNIKNPVLVRQVEDGAPVDAITQSTAGGADMSASESAKTDADKITLDTLYSHEKGDKELIRRIVKDLETKQNRNQLYTEDGKVSSDGMRKAQNALWAKAYGDEYVLGRLTESMDNNIRNIANAMLKAAPKMAILNEEIKAGNRFNYPVSDTISDAAKTIITLRDKNESVSYFLQETDLFGSPIRNLQSVKDVVAFMDSHKRSAKDIHSFIDGFIDKVDMLGHPKQDSLIETKRPTLNELVNLTAKEQGDGLQSLFDTERTTGETESSKDSGRMADGTMQSEAGNNSTVQEAEEQKEEVKAPDEVEVSDEDTADIEALQEALQKKGGAVFNMNDYEDAKAQRGASYTLKEYVNDWMAQKFPNVPKDNPAYEALTNKVYEEVSNAEQAESNQFIDHVREKYNQGMTDMIDLRRDFIKTFGVQNIKEFSKAFHAVENGGNNDVYGSTGTVAERTGERTDKNAVGRNDEGEKSTGRDGQRVLSPGERQEEQQHSDSGVRERSTTTGRETGDSRVQTEKSDDNSGSTGNPKLSRSVRDSLEGQPYDAEKRSDELVTSTQDGQDNAAVKLTEKEASEAVKKVKEEIPQLMTEQAEDVVFAKERLITNGHNGIMFTNGTGTGKTFTGLGVAKSYANKGKDNILIIAPSKGIIKQWIDTAKKNFSMDLHLLEDTEDKGKGATITTFANAGINDSLINRNWDLIIVDESHNLMSSESGTKTKALNMLHALTHHEDGFNKYFEATHKKEYDKLHELSEKSTKSPEDRQAYYNYADELKEKQKAAYEDYQSKDKAKVVFLSATPFSHVSNVDYANGYLFDYGDYGSKTNSGYNATNGRENFFVQNFGYRMRYNKLTKPDAEVDNSLMERQFHDKLVKDGALRGRVLSSDYDYDRGFILVDSGIGKTVDEGFKWLSNNKALNELNEYMRSRFNHYARMYFLEAIKVKEAMPLIKEYIKSGKKVVVFHDYKKGGSVHPFRFPADDLTNVRDTTDINNHSYGDQLKEQYLEFQRQRPDLFNLNMDELLSPIEAIKKTFGEEAVIYNGDISTKERNNAQKAFNDDNSKVKVILVQSAAGQAGLSLHDTTGKHQRVEINLGLPTRPVTAIQEEGRIYRVGNKSNAIFRYLNTGTLMEQTAFATRIAERSSTVENLALGDQARALKESFINAFNESQEGDGWKRYLPGNEAEGTGGKAADRAFDSGMSDFDRAKTFYYAQQKKNAGNKSSEGSDYYATPEPIGLKMVEWADLEAGERALEPSAGHGAIARWLPENTRNVVIEPSSELVPKLTMATPNAKVVHDTYENHHLSNRYDAIVMNPPFGKNGKTAIEHLAKAFYQLNANGRVVAIIPDGPATQKYFNEWINDEDIQKYRAQVKAEIKLPGVTFKRAGTNVNTKIVVIDRVLKTDEKPLQVTIKGDSIQDVFDQVENLEIPKREGHARQYSATDEVVSKRTLEAVKKEVQDMFKWAKNVKEISDRLVQFTMPNNTKVFVDIKDKIAVSEEQLQKARQDHGINKNANVQVEGYTDIFDRTAYIALSQGGRKGVGYHELFHMVYNMLLTDKEKTVLGRYFKNEEEMAEAYRKWVLDRKNNTQFGKIWQKIKDFCRKIANVLGRAEDVEDIMRKIESGEVYNREGRTKENTRDYLVTNKNVTGETQVKITDVTNQEKINLRSKGKVSEMMKSLLGQTFEIANNNIGKMSTKDETRHFVVSSNKENRYKQARLKSLNFLKEVLKNAVYIEKHIDDRHHSNLHYIEFFAAIKDGDHLWRFRIVAKENNETAGEFKIGEARFYDLLQYKEDLATTSALGRQLNVARSSSTISLADLLRGVKDRNGKLYVNEDGSLNYDARIFTEEPEEAQRHYSIREEDEAQEEKTDKKETFVTPDDILESARKILPIYTKSKLTADSHAQQRYDAHSKAGFVPTPNAKNIGRVLALFVDRTLKVKGANMELTNAIMDEIERRNAYATLYKEKDITQMGPAQARMEGVSKFGSLYFTDSEFAEETFPEYTKRFEEALKENPKLKEKIDAFKELVQKEQEQNPLLRANGGIRQPKKKNRTFKERVSDSMRKLYADFIDDKDVMNQYVKQAEHDLGQKIAYEDDFYKRARMAKGVAGARATMLTTGGKNTRESFKVLREIYGAKAMRHDVLLNDVFDTMQKVTQKELEEFKAKDAREALGKYLIAARIKELSVKEREYVAPHGYDPATVSEILAKAPKAIKQAARMYWDFNDNIIGIIQKEGLIDDQTAQNLRKYEHYCPMYHEIEDTNDLDVFIDNAKRKGGYVNVDSGIEYLDGGSTRAVTDPIESMIRMTTALINKTERNNVAKSMVRFSQKYKDMGNILVRDTTLKSADPTKCAFSVLVNGKKIVYRTTPEMYDILTTVNENTMNIFLYLSNMIATCMRQGATMSPSFIMRNFMRDTITASINTKTGFIPIVDSLRGAYKLKTDPKFNAEYHASGASMGTFIRANFESANKIIKQKTGEKYKNMAPGYKELRKLLDGALRTYNSFANLVEDSSRAGEFMRARQKGLTLEQAGYLAKEITIDFSRAGNLGRKYNKYTAFFNAQIQGVDKMVRVIAENPLRAATCITKFAILPSLILWAMNHDDDWYKNLDPSTKYQNWCIGLGGYHMLIPKPQEWGVLFGSGIEAALNKMMGDDPRAMKQWAGRVAENVTPNIIPTAIVPIIEAVTDYDFWHNRSLTPQRLKNLPSEQQYINNTSELAKALGDTWGAKYFKLSPIKIDRFVTGYFASAGRFIASMLNEPINAIRGTSRLAEQSKYWYEQPFVGSFLRQDGQDSETVNRFYDLYEKLNEEQARNDAVREQNGKKKGKKSQAMRNADQAMKTIRDYNKKIREIQNSRKLDGDEKRKRIDALKEKTRKLAKKFVDKYDE